ncbi:MAG: hypothetical protein ACQ5SW_13485 [Sphaerochaetaceae bacterium]
MKKRIRILSTTSVFFIILILLSSCGIPTIFYIDSSITQTSSLDDSVAGKYTVHSDEFDNLSWINPGSGPSLMLFYLVTNEQGPPSNISSAFYSQYQRNSATVSISSENEVLTINGYTLYGFSDSQGTNFTRPYFIASADDPHNPDFTCTIKKNDTISGSTKIDMTLSFDPTDEYSIHKSSTLRRYNGEKFEIAANNVRNPLENYPEYHNIDIATIDMYCHIYAAVNVSEGSFDNNYWTDLEYLGNIQLNEE